MTVLRRAVGRTVELRNLSVLSFVNLGTGLYPWRVRSHLLEYGRPDLESVRRCSLTEPGRSLISPPCVLGKAELCQSAAMASTFAERLRYLDFVTFEYRNKVASCLERAADRGERIANGVKSRLRQMTNNRAERMTTRLRGTGGRILLFLQSQAQYCNLAGIACRRVGTVRDAPHLYWSYWQNDAFHILSAGAV